MLNIVLNQVPDAVPDALEAEAPQGHPRRWAILALILAVEVMDLIDGTIVNVASPAIRGSLGASLSALQWIAGGYALTFAIGLATRGPPGRIFPRPPAVPRRRRRLHAHVRAVRRGAVARDADRHAPAPGPVRGDHDPAGLRHPQAGLPG